MGCQGRGVTFFHTFSALALGIEHTFGTTFESRVNTPPIEEFVMMIGRPVGGR